MTEIVACSCCGMLTPVSALKLSFKLPEDVFKLSQSEQDKHGRLSSEYVVLNDNRFFVRGLIPLPVFCRAEPYHIGAWAEVSERHFFRVLQLSTKPAQASAPPISARLANLLPYHESTLGLPITLQLTGPDTRPAFQLRPCKHALYVEQSEGIDETRVLQYCYLVLAQGRAEGAYVDPPAAPEATASSG